MSEADIAEPTELVHVFIDLRWNHDRNRHGTTATQLKSEVRRFHPGSVTGSTLTIDSKGEFRRFRNMCGNGERAGWRDYGCFPFRAVASIVRRSFSSN